MQQIYKYRFAFEWIFVLMVAIKNFQAKFRILQGLVGKILNVNAKYGNVSGDCKINIFGCVEIVYKSEILNFFK